MHGKIFYHGSCFDGASSAALFAEFYRHRHAGATLAYEGMNHTTGDPFATCELDGDDNICVDFRYCADPRMTWWFDHHVSAFQPASLRESFEASTSGQMIYDPQARSCAILIARSLAERFAFEHQGETWRELVEWADKIDGAQFESAREAVELDAPALEITTWLANFGANRSADVSMLIERLGRVPLAEIADQPWIREPLVPILESNRQHIDLIAKRSVVSKSVVTYDLSRDGVSAHNKFIAYMLYPEARYTIGITLTSEHAKISVGANPWAHEPREHNIALICEAFGGGGHPFVGGVSVAKSEIERARVIAREIGETLEQAPTSAD